MSTSNLRKHPSVKTRNPLGWGYLEDAVTPKEKETIQKIFSALAGPLGNKSQPLSLDSIRLSKGRKKVPRKLAAITSTDDSQRLLRACGRSFRDLAMLREKKILPAPDVVGLPANRDDLERLLEWAWKEKLAVIPFGGGSSVVGGVNPEGTAKFNGTLTIDLQKMDRVYHVSPAERVVRADAGILGPRLDQILKEHSLHVRHMPQSYHHSTLGGWIASRGAGHNSTTHTKIEERVQALSGMLVDGQSFSTRPLPATSVAIDPRSYWAGSEGMLGIIDTVTLRVYPLPKYRGFRGIAFERFEQAMGAARLIAQSDLHPVQIRLLDADEFQQTARLSGNEPEKKCLMILADESQYDVVDQRLSLFESIALQSGGKKDSGTSRILREWVRLFFRQPHMRDYMIDHSLIVDTFETAIGWERAEAFYHEIKSATRAAMGEICGDFHVGCRATHVYTDGLCLYFSFYGPGKRGSLLKQWFEIKDAVSRAVVKNGGTISHHHAMGRDHKKYAKKEFPRIHRAAVRGLKSALDPKGQMNPGLWFGR